MAKMLLFVCVAVGLAVVAGCQPPLKEYVSKEYKFRVKFPGSPEVKDQTAAGIQFKMFSTESRSGANVVGVADMPIPANESAAMIQQRLDGARDGAIKNIGGTQTSSTSIVMAGKYPGREFSASITQPTKGQVRARIWLVGTRLYQIMVVGTDSYATSKDSTAFLDSFQLTE